MTIGWLVRLPADDTAPLRWRRIDANAAMPDWQVEPPDVAALGSGPVWALAPTSRLLLQTLRLPVRGRSALAQAVPYALEESLPGEVEEYHFVIGPRQGDGGIPVLAAARADVARWRARLIQAGMGAVPLVPACLALAWEPGSWTVALEPEGEVNVRTGPWSGWGCERPVFEALLRRMLADAAPRPQRLRFVAEAAELRARAPLLADWTLETLSPTQAWDGQTLDTAVSLALDDASTGSGSTALGDLFQRWRWPLALLALWGVLAGGLVGYRVHTLERERVLLAGQMETLYRDHFPEARRVVDPPAQMAQQLRRLRQSSGADPLLRLLGAVSGPLTGLPGYALDDLRYQEGVLEMAVRTADLAALEALSAPLIEARVRMSRLSASAENGATRARIRVEALP
ncbi:MAG: type II secretion system protein GspL [Pseudomonadota bacterium]